MCIRDSQGSDRALHALNPAARQSVAIAIIIQRNDFVEQGSIEIFAIARIVDVHIGMSTSLSNRESVQAVEGFRPPPVQNREIQSAVQNDFLAAGAGSLERAARIIQPHIDALHLSLIHI